MKLNPTTNTITVESDKDFRSSSLRDSLLSITNGYTLVIEEKVTYLPDKIFTNLPLIKNLEIKCNPNTISDNCFESSKICSVTFRNKCSTLGIGMFKNCYKLEEVFLSDAITEIPAECFMGCENLSFIKLLNIELIDDSAFQFCSTLTEVQFGDCLCTIGNNSFANTGIIKLHLTDGISSIGEGSFEYCNSLTDLYVGKSLAYLPNKAFYKCTKLLNITLPSGIALEGKPFKGCTLIPANHLLHDNKRKSEYYSTTDASKNILDVRDENEMKSTINKMLNDNDGHIKFYSLEIKPIDDKTLINNIVYGDITHSFDK